LLSLRSLMPDLQPLFEKARRGLEFFGASATEAARLLEAIGPASGLQHPSMRQRAWPADPEIVPTFAADSHVGGGHLL
jgi:hypothetical protein